MSRGKFILSLLEKQQEQNFQKEEPHKDFSYLHNKEKPLERHESTHSGPSLPSQLEPEYAEYTSPYIQNLPSTCKSVNEAKIIGLYDNYTQPSTSKGLIEAETSSSESSIESGHKRYTLFQNDESDEGGTSGSEYLPNGDESSDESDDEPLSNIRDKANIIYQNSAVNIPEKGLTTPENKIIAHVTADSDVWEDLNQEQVLEEKKQKVKRKIFEGKEKTTRARSRNPNTWKKRKSAIARQKGEEYISQTGKVIPEKKIKLGMLCKENCRLNCSEKFSDEDRKVILKKYYSLDINSKNSLLFSSININPVKRHRTGAKNKKHFTFKYSVAFNKKTEIICRDAMCSLYQFSRKRIERIQNMLKKGQNAPSPDKRGRHENRPHKISDEVVAYITNHIQKFPAYESHYSRNKNCHKKYLSPLLNMTEMYRMYLQDCEENNLGDSFKIKLSSYAYIFSNKFNLSFGQPRSDTCSVCDSGQNSEIHTENYNAAFDSQKRDREKPVNEKNICFITMNLQQTMPLPKLSTSKAFYLRQMWFYNFGIHCITSEGPKPFFFNWTEDVANRGSLEVASCLFRFCQLLKNDYQIDHLIIWSDSCAGQNKNFTIICLYQLLILNGMFKVIDHKYPEVGHSYLDSDRNFGRIEKKLRKCENIYVPEQYRDVIKSASARNSICVNMENYFLDFDELPTKLHLCNKKKNALNEKVSFRDSIKWVRVDQFGSYLYKENLDEMSPFHKVDLLKKGSRIVAKEDNIKVERIKERRGGLTSEKLSNLREQLVFIRDEYKWFYERVLEENEENPKKKRKTM